MHIDEGANVQLCQSVRGQMSLHAIFGQGANVRGGTCPTLLRQSPTQTGLCSEKRSRNLKSQMGCSYLCSENKVADQLCGISVLYKHDSEEIPTQTPKNKIIHNIEQWFVTHIC